MEQAQREADDAVGAAAGGMRSQVELRQVFGNLMHAMRDLLNQIQPVPPPTDDRENDDDDNEWD